jgi:hypothetical protein
VDGFPQPATPPEFASPTLTRVSLFEQKVKVFNCPRKKSEQR